MLLEELKARQDNLKKGQAELVQQISQLNQLLDLRKADLYATGGAIQECAFWINKLTPGLSLPELSKVLETPIEYVEKKE